MGFLNGGCHDCVESRKRWNTFEHNGVLFPPDYITHGVKIKYDGVEVTLSPEQEEAATFYAVMLDTDYASKPAFRKNFWEDFRALLGEDHQIQDFDKIDFRPIYEWNKEEKLKAKNLSKEEKHAIKEAKTAAEEKYKTAIVDGCPQQVHTPTVQHIQATQPPITSRCFFNF